MKKIGFAVALEAELTDFLNAFKNAEIIKKGAYSVIFVKSGEKELYVLKTGVGEISAAAATQFLITAFNVEAIINFGVCGKINPKYKLLDTAAIKSVVHYRFDTSAVDGVPAGTYDGFKTPYIPADEKLLSVLRSVCPNIKLAICASGDKFVGDDDTKKYLKQTFNADVCEMEAAGVLITASRNGVPVLMVKSVSDDCDGFDFNEYVKSAAKMHTEIILKLINAL
ncbi:MAG: 5'-methylthioadenosine/S-adenosylhomocysteine nucleosidase [Candidatus Borkfalkiaceae bacterium]|nr:5'-methylthioadenosine/S-adenosylhomocysteine nucleosidase [Christensenellaceae bacterium]